MTLINIPVHPALQYLRNERRCRQVDGAGPAQEKNAVCQSRMNATMQQEMNVANVLHWWAPWTNESMFARFENTFAGNFQFSLHLTNRPMRSPSPFFILSMWLQFSYLFFLSTLIFQIIQGISLAKLANCSIRPCLNRNPSDPLLRSHWQRHWNCYFLIFKVTNFALPSTLLRQSLTRPC